MRPTNHSRSAGCPRGGRYLAASRVGMRRPALPTAEPRKCSPVCLRHKLSERRRAQASPEGVWAMAGR
jgi:hypothetical protein